MAEPVLEELAPELRTFFDEPNYAQRWDRLRDLAQKDHASFRVLFVVETLGLIDKWREPTSAELNAILNHMLEGGVVASRIGRVIDLMQPVWPLEIAKLDVLIYEALTAEGARGKYPFTSIRCFATALVQSWWAFEIMMNDFAGIIAEQRKATLDRSAMQMLLEVRPNLDKQGRIVEEPYYQKLLERLQFIYSVLTSSELDRKSSTWMHLVELKNVRDTYVHRIGKGGGESLGDDKVVRNGLAAVRQIVGEVLSKTPEFAERFVYKYLAYWSCGSDSPIVWDGAEGNSFYLGLSGIKAAPIAALYAPQPGSFREPPTDISERLKELRKDPEVEASDSGQK